MSHKDGTSSIKLTAGSRKNKTQGRDNLITEQNIEIGT